VRSGNNALHAVGGFRPRSSHGPPTRRASASGAARPCASRFAWGTTVSYMLGAPSTTSQPIKPSFYNIAENIPGQVAPRAGGKIRGAWREGSMRTRDFIGKLREFGPNAYMWGVGICDCGDRPRHNNGGNYHPQVEVRYSAWWKYAITLGDTREFFPGDKWEGCSCGAAFRDDEQHIHVSSARKAAQAVRKHLGGEGVLYLRTPTGEMIDRQELRR
jgi:hypothetical protein